MDIYSLLLIFTLNVVSSKWLPSLSFQPDFNQFQSYDSESFGYIYPSVPGNLPENFEWQTITSVSLISRNISYIVYGGSQQVKNSNSAFSKENSMVRLCKVKWKKASHVENVKCSSMHSDGNNRYLGASLKAAPVSKNEAVLVYCDPLWHITDIKEPKPSGKCYITLLGNDILNQNKSVEFCKLSSTSYSSCMGGFSVDLTSLGSLISEIQMVVGLPLMIPYGGVELINNPFGSHSLSEPRTWGGKYFNYGYAVSMTSNAGAYVSSPLSDQYGPNVTNIREDIQLTSPDNNPFSSFGVSLTTLSVSKGRKHAVIIGAPYHTVKAIQNVGKVYVFCSSNSDQRLLSSTLYGQKKDEFFGYSLANIGDINGDGNDDIAIGSPFLRNNDENGFISLYTVNENCELGRKPHQILKSNRSIKSSIFGIAITGGSDLDFNSWPDIVVANSRSNVVELYTSRQLLLAKCKFTVHNNYETQILSKGNIISISINLILVDIKRNDHISMDFFEKIQIISQVDPNVNVSKNRFELKESVKLDMSSNSASARFSIISLQHVKDMNLTTPVTVAFRFIEDCAKTTCNNFQFPLINWEMCTTQIPIRKYICSANPNCDADIAVDLIDEIGNEVLLKYDKNYHRSLKIRIYNYGPTEAKDIKMKITTYQNLRINKLSTTEDVNMKDQISSNQTEADVRLDQYEMDVMSPESDPPIVINIDLYFIDYQSSTNMNYENNSIVVKLFSDVVDSNLTNNIARIDYLFVYEPNISYSGFTKLSTVVDNRKTTQPLRRGQRIQIDSIGPHLSQNFTIDNIGKAPVFNMSVRISLPILTKDGIDILYLFEEIRGINKSRVTAMSISPHVIVDSNKYPCYLPRKFVNPYNIIGLEGIVAHLTDMEMTQPDGIFHLLKKRSAGAEEIKIRNPNQNIEIAQGKMHRFPLEIIQCNRSGINLQSPVCGDIICKIPVLPSNKQARIQINAWLLAHTFFKKHISDVMVFTTMNADFGSPPTGVKFKDLKYKPFSQFQQFIFKHVKPKIVHIKPTWPIIVGIVIGVLILAVLIVAMYKCGFFKRSKRVRRIKSKKKKNDPVIVHPYEMGTSTIRSETKSTSHSALISSKDKTPLN